METQVQTENYLPGHYSMVDLNRELNGVGWPSCSSDANLPNGQFYYGFPPRTNADSHTGCDTDIVKQTMLEHEAILKDQVCELHRLYRVQRELMDKVTRKEQLQWCIPYETSSTASPLPSQMQSNDAQSCNGSSFSFASPVSGRPHISGPYNVQSSPNFTKGKSTQDGPSLFQNCHSPKNSEVSESPPTKFRKRMLDLERPADDFIDTSEVKQFDMEKDGLWTNKSKALTDLNESFHEVTTTLSSVDFLSLAASNGDVPYRDLPERLLTSSNNISQKIKNGILNRSLKSVQDIRGNAQDWFRYALESEQYKANGKSINQVTLPEKAHVLDHIKGEPWKSNFVGRTEKSDRSCSILNLNNSPQSSAQKNDFCCNNLNLNSTPGANEAFGSDPVVRNGFYRGSPSGLKELSARFLPPGFDYTNYGSENTALYNISNSLKGTGCNDVNQVKEMNLDVALLNGVSNRYINGSENLKNGFNSLKISQDLSGASTSCVVKSESSRNFLGVSIFGKPLIPKEENHSAAMNTPVIHLRSRNDEIECKKRKGFFDMNIPCEDSDSEHNNMSVDEVLVSQKKETISEPVKYKKCFDLNSCLSEEETPCGKGIDLEALINLEMDNVILPVEDSSINEPDNKTDDNVAELAKSAASAIVAMSSFVEYPIRALIEAEVDDPLDWFVNIACSTLPVQDDGLSGRLEDFEYVILRQKECTPEDYFPKPSIPDFQFIENNTCVLTKTRTRKGQARRGRQRRDFQRDILPGLVTLSRNEVTEDIQVFGGLFGPNHRIRPRNGRGRGRKRSVVGTSEVANTIFALPLKQQETQVDSNTAEVGVKDISLMGWGKTTRRPRRQRCSAGNPALLMPLT